MSIEVAKLMVVVGWDDDAAARGMSRLKVEVKGAADETSKAMGGVRKSAKDADDGLMGFVRNAGASAVGFLGRDLVAASGRAVQEFFTMGNAYSANLAVFQEVSHASAGEMDKVRDKARELGADLGLPATSAADAAEAMTELAKAGLTVQNTLAASRGTIALAAAANTSEAQAAEIAATALNAFALRGSEANRVADLLAASANASSAEITDMADALRMSSTVANQAGQKIEDVIAALAEMANKSLKGQDAGTSLKQMLLSLIAPTHKASETMHALGVDVYDAQGRMLPMRDVIGQFEQALAGLTEKQRNSALATIFGSDAIRAAGTILDGGVKQFDAMKEAVTRQGAASELAAARMKGLGGAIQGLQSEAETLALDFYEKVSPTIEDATRWLATELPVAASTAGDFLASVWDHAEGPLTTLGGDVKDLAVFLGHVVDAGEPAVEMFLQLGGGAVLGGLGAVAGLLSPIASFLSENEQAARLFAVALTGLAIAKGLESVFGRGGLIDGIALRFMYAKDAATGFTISLAGVKSAVMGLPGAAAVLALGINAIAQGLESAHDQAQKFRDAATKGIDTNTISGFQQYYFSLVRLEDGAWKAAKAHDGFLETMAGVVELSTPLTNSVLDANVAYNDLRDTINQLSPEQQRMADRVNEITRVTGMSVDQIDASLRELGISVDTFRNDDGSATEQVVQHWLDLAHTVDESTGQQTAAIGMTSDELKELAKRAQELRDAMASSFNASTSVVAAFGDQTKVTRKQVMEFFAKSVEDARNWSANLKELIADGVDNGLVQELAQAGPKAAPLVAALLDAVRHGDLAAINQAQTDLRQILSDTQNAVLGSVPDFQAAGTKVGEAAASGIQEGVNNYKYDPSGIVNFFNSLVDIAAGKGVEIGNTAGQNIMSTVNNAATIAAGGGGTPSLGNRAPARHSAHGRIVNSPLLTWVGEQNRREVILPLTNPSRTRELAAQSGLYDVLGVSPVMPASGGQSIVYAPNVTIDAQGAYFGHDAPPQLVAAVREGLKRANGFRADTSLVPSL